MLTVGKYFTKSDLLTLISENGEPRPLNSVVNITYTPQSSGLNFFCTGNFTFSVNGVLTPAGYTRYSPIAVPSNPIPELDVEHGAGNFWLYVLNNANELDNDNIIGFVANGYAANSLTMSDAMTGVITEASYPDTFPDLTDTIGDNFFNINYTGLIYDTTSGSNPTLGEKVAWTLCNFPGTSPTNYHAVPNTIYESGTHAGEPVAGIIVNNLPNYTNAEAFSFIDPSDWEVAYEWHYTIRDTEIAFDGESRVFMSALVTFLTNTPVPEPTIEQRVGELERKVEELEVQIHDRSGNFVAI